VSGIGSGKAIRRPHHFISDPFSHLLRRDFTNHTKDGHDKKKKRKNLNDSKS